jgi:hypothetical protein
MRRGARRSSRKKAGAGAGRHGARSAAVVLASMLALTGSAAASLSPQQCEEAIAKLSPGALKRLLLNLRLEDQQSAGRSQRLAQQHSSFASSPQP